MCLFLQRIFSDPYKSVSRAEKRVSAAIKMESFSCLTIINGFAKQEMIHSFCYRKYVSAITVVLLAVSTIIPLPIICVMPVLSSLLIVSPVTCMSICYNWMLSKFGFTGSFVIKALSCFNSSVGTILNKCFCNKSYYLRSGII